MMNTEKKSSGLAALFLLLATLGRLIPHPANVTPVGALALVGGGTLKGAWRWAVPLLALGLTDCLLGFTYVTPFIYASFLVSILLGQKFLRNSSYLRLGFLSLLGSGQFFLVSNFGVWMEGLLYPKTWEGLAACYVMALPFLKNAVLGDLFWSFGLYALIERSRVWVLRKSLQPS